MVPVVLCVFVVIAGALVTFMAARRSRGAFEERFPPISDAEFVARCPPGTRPEVALRVRRIVADRVGVECERVHPSARFIEDLGAD